MTNEDIITLLGAIGPLTAGAGAAVMHPEGERLAPALGAGAGSLAGGYGGSLLGALAGGGLGAGAGALYDEFGGRSFLDDLSGEPTGAQVGAAYGVPIGGILGAMAGGAYGSRKGYGATAPDQAQAIDKTSSYQENTMSMQKVAAGYGAIERLNQGGIDPVQFVKVAAQSNDQEMHVLADCIIAAAQDDERTKTANAGRAARALSEGGAGRGANLANAARHQAGGIMDQLREMFGAIPDMPQNFRDMKSNAALSNAADQGLGSAADFAASGMPGPQQGPEQLAALSALFDAAEQGGGEAAGRLGQGMGGLGIGAAGIGGLGAAGYGGYEAMREPTMMERLGLG